MNYIFDTNTISFLYDETREPFHSCLFAFISNLKKDDNLYISILTLYELEYSLSNSPKKEQVKKVLESVLKFFEVLDLPTEGAKIFGDLKQIYKKKTGITKENIKKNNVDLMVASTAIINSCIMVSFDSIFESISNTNYHLEVLKL